MNDYTFFLPDDDRPESPIEAVCRIIRGNSDVDDVQYHEADDSSVVVSSAIGVTHPDDDLLLMQFALRHEAIANELRAQHYIAMGERRHQTA